MSQTRVKVATRSGPSRIMSQRPPQNGGVTRVQPGITHVLGSVPRMHTGPRRITIVPAPPPKEVPPPKPKAPVQTSSTAERPKSRTAAKFPPVGSSQSRLKVSSRTPSVTEGPRKELEVPKPTRTRTQSQTKTTRPAQMEKTKEVSLAPPRNRARTGSNARPLSRVGLPKSAQPSSRVDSTESTRSGTVTTTKVVDKRKHPEPRPAPSKDLTTNPPHSIPLPPSPVLPSPATADSLPSLKLETEVKFVPPLTMSPRKATAETKVVHALKMGDPLRGAPSPSPPPTTRPEGVLPQAQTPEPVMESEEPATDSVQGPFQVQEPVVEVVEQYETAPVPETTGPAGLSPVFVHPVAEPPMPLRVRGKERINKVGNLVAHFEDTTRHKPVHPPRRVEQTPISALVSTIRKGFEDMRPLPALDIVEEGDSVDMISPPRPADGLKVGSVRGLNISSKSTLGERTALTTVQLNG